MCTCASATWAQLLLSCHVKGSRFPRDSEQNIKTLYSLASATCPHLFVVSAVKVKLSVLHGVGQLVHGGHHCAKRQSANKIAFNQDFHCKVRLTALLLWRTLIGEIPMVTMAQSAANWCNMHRDSTHSLTHLHQHNYNHVVRSISWAIIFQCMLGLFVFP